MPCIIMVEKPVAEMNSVVPIFMYVSDPPVLFWKERQELCNGLARETRDETRRIRILGFILMIIAVLRVIIVSSKCS